MIELAFNRQYQQYVSVVGSNALLGCLAEALMCLLIVCYCEPDMPVWAK